MYRWSVENISDFRATMWEFGGSIASRPYSEVVGQSWKNDMRVVLFVQLAPGFELTDELKNRIRQTIRTHASPRHVPANSF